MVRGSISGLGVVESPGGKALIRVLAGLKQEAFSDFPDFQLNVWRIFG